jgi:mycofactocin precursor
MTAETATATPTQAPTPAEASHPASDGDVLTADSLIEEVSIDGMCGVY